MASEIMINVCVRLQPHADAEPIRKAVVGRRGRLRPRHEPSRFWAVTAMTLKQVEVIEGVKSCTLSPAAW